jgi:hypothetical protein
VNSLSNTATTFVQDCLVFGRLSAYQRTMAYKSLRCQASKVTKVPCSLFFIVLLYSFSSLSLFRQSTTPSGVSFVVQAMSSKATATTTKTPSTSYDLVVVGGGSAGLTAAKLAGKTLHKSVVIVEANKLGGDCTWTGTSDCFLNCH